MSDTPEPPDYEDIPPPEMVPDMPTDFSAEEAAEYAAEALDMAEIPDMPDDVAARLAEDQVADPAVNREDSSGLATVSSVAEPTPGSGGPTQALSSQSAAAPAPLTDLSALRTAPHSIEAEQAVLGGVMLNNAAWFDVADLLSAHDFYRDAHRTLYEELTKLSAGGQPLDAVTVAEALKERGELESIGGVPYIADLVDNTPAATNAIAYARIVHERATRRRLLDAANLIADAAHLPEGRNTNDLLNYAEEQVFKIHDDRSGGQGAQSVVPLLERTIRKVESLFQNPNPITGLPTGFHDLDMKTSGLHPGQLVIVAARPAMGKTSLAMNMVEHALMDDSPGAVLVFNLEMPGESLVMRMLSSLGRLSQSRVRTGQLKDDEWPRLVSAVGLLQDKPLFIDDTASLTPADVRTRARRIAREHGGVKLIVIDYLQLMRSTERIDNRVQEVSEISRSLKLVANEMKCPVIALSQLNRGLEQRQDKRPMMSDLRESGSIEQDADMIFFIYRDEVYNEDSMDTGKAEIIIGKQRNGPIGKVEVAFLGELVRFENLDTQHRPEMTH